MKGFDVASISVCVGGGAAFCLHIFCAQLMNEQNHPGMGEKFQLHTIAHPHSTAPCVIRM